jgi:LmbE family N-acetylglucosaminyl deacetylase
MVVAEREKLKILVITAHPHDFTHCSGTCGIHATMGDEVTVVSVTGGGHTHNEKLHDELLKPEAERDPAVLEQSGDDYMATKKKELGQVCALFGIADVRVLDFPDKPFKRTPAAVEALRDIILEVRPDVLIPQSPFLNGPKRLTNAGHDDHLETAFATMEAQALAGIPDFGSTQTPHTIAATYYPAVYFQPDEIDFYVDISAWKERRIQAEMLFASQSQSEAFGRKRVEIQTGSFGWRGGTDFAEGFVRSGPELLPHIEVPRAALIRAHEPRENHLKRLAGELEE